MTKHDRDPYLAPALKRGLRALELIAASRTPLSLSELSRQLNVNRSSMFRLLHTLRTSGYVSVAEDGGFVPASRLLNLGYDYLQGRPIVDVARPSLTALSDATGLDAQLMSLDGDAVVCIDARRGGGPYMMFVPPGWRRPAYASPAGWILMSDHDRVALAARCGHGPFPALTEHTPTDLDTLLERTRAARRDGFVTSHGFLEPGGTSVSAPIRNAAGDVAASISIAGPSASVDASALGSRYVSMVVDAAAQVSAQLGGER